MSKSIEGEFRINNDSILKEMIIDQLSLKAMSVDSEVTLLVKELSMEVKVCVVLLYKAVAIEDSIGVARSIKTYHALVETNTKKVTDITGLLGFAVE